MIPIKHPMSTVNVAPLSMVFNEYNYTDSGSWISAILGACPIVTRIDVRPFEPGRMCSLEVNLWRANAKFCHLNPASAHRSVDRYGSSEAELVY